MAYQDLYLYSRDGTQDKSVPVGDAVAAGLVVAPVTSGGVTQTVAQHLAGKAPANVVVQTQVAVGGTPAPRGLLDVLPEIVGDSDILARTYFGVVADGVLTVNSSGVATATGTDNTAAINSYALWCRDNNQALVLPPGDYVVNGRVEFWGNVTATGARLLIPNNSAPDIKIVINPLPGDISPIPVSEVRAWSGCYRGSRKIVGLNNRRGQIVSINSPDQILIRRGPDSSNRVSLMGQTFVVATNDGEIATSLIGDWTNSTWTTENGTGAGEDKTWYRAETPRDRVVIRDLAVVLYDDGASNSAGYVLQIKRSNTTTEGLRIINRVGRSIAQAVNTDRVSEYRDIGGLVEGTLVSSTSYGWNHSLGVNIYHEGSKALNCRRGIDNHRSTDILLLNCTLPTGWGAHYGWRMGSIGGVLGCKGQDNGVITVAGGDFFVHDADVQIEGTVAFTPHAIFPTFIRARGDFWECGGKVESRGCRITATGPAAFVYLTNFFGPAGGYDTSRATEMPRQIKVSAQVTLLGDANQRLHLIQWFQNWAPELPGSPPTPAQMPQPLLVECEQEFDVVVRFAKGGLLHSNGEPRVLAEYWSPPCANAGQSYEGYVRAKFRGLPCFHLITRTGYAEAVNTKARLDADIEASGPVRVVKSVGAYRKIEVKSPSLEQLIGSGTSGYTAIGDEEVYPVINTFYRQGRTLGRAVALDPLDASSVRPTMNAQFQPSYTAPSGSFSRSTTGSYRTSSGVIVQAAASEMRFDADATTGENLGLSIEGTRTNFFLQSAAPANQTIALLAGTYCLSVVEGAGSIALSGAVTGNATPGTPLSFTLAASGNVTATVSSTVRKAQLENGAYPTSFIQTTTTAATRAFDSFSHTLPANWWNESEGTFYVDAVSAFGAAGAQQVFEIGDGSTNNRVVIYRDTARSLISVVVVGGVVSGINLGAGTWPDNTRRRIALAVGGGTMAMSVDGGAVRTVAANGLPPATVLRIGDRPAGNRLWDRTIARFGYIPRRADDLILPVISA